MSGKRDIERILDDWLAEGATKAPDRILSNLDARIRRQPQQRRQFLAGRWRRDIRPLAAAAAAVVVAGLLLWRSPGQAIVGATQPPASVTPSGSPVNVTSPAATSTGSMTAERAYQTATLLADGRILMAGGWGSVRQGNLTLQGEVVASAELYDPKTGTFSPTGSMTVPRNQHTATLLADGRVLILGGYGSGEVLASAELYDPTTGTFSATGSMTVPREAHTATLLADGRVLIAGGDDGSNALATAEIFDPKTFTFSPTGPMTTPRTEATATLLPDGRVLIVGGSGPLTSSPNQTSAELYDPKTGTFSATGSMRTARAGDYDPKTGTFSATGSMRTARAGHTATLLSDGRVLVAGGSGTDGQGLTSAELYDPQTGTFSVTGSMTAGRFQQTATLLPGGRVLVAGGFIDGGMAAGGSTNTVVSSLASAELYDPTTGTFSATGSMRTPRAGHAATLLSGGRVLVAGGSANTAGDNLASTELYDPKTGTFGPTGP